MGRSTAEVFDDHLCRAGGGDIALLERTAASAGTFVRDGADSFLVRNGCIRIMTIHYTVETGRG